MTEFYQNLSDLPEDEKLLEMQKMRDEAWYANIDWLNQAELCHKFKSGDQWSDEEKIKLQAQNREGLVWNYIHSGVELISGTLAQNPIRIYPYPVERSDDFLCEVMEDLIIYVDENQCNAEDEEEKAFESGIITGIGDVVVDVNPHPDNPLELQFSEHALEAYEVLVDPAYRKSDLSDARYALYEKWITMEDFKVRYPKHIKDIEEIFAVVSGRSEPEANSYSDSYEIAPFEYYDEQSKRILVTHFEYRQAYKRYYYYTQTEGQEAQEISQKQSKEIKSQGLPGQVIEIYDTKVHWCHHIHDRVLWEGESPVFKKNFSICRMQVYSDRST